MPKLADPDIFGLLATAFQAATRFVGYVLWKPQALVSAGRDFPGITPELVNESVLAHLCSNGCVKYAKETREEWLRFPFHYDVVVSAAHWRDVYVEMVIACNDPDDPTIWVVSCHRDVK